MPIEVNPRTKGDVVEIPREEFERLMDTLEFLENEDLKEGILRSLKDYESGRTRSWEEVREDL